METIAYIAGVVRNLTGADLIGFVVVAISLLAAGAWVFSDRRYSDIGHSFELWKVRWAFVPFTAVILIGSFFIVRGNAEDRYAVEVKRDLARCEATAKARCDFQRSMLKRLGAEMAYEDYLIF